MKKIFYLLTILCIISCTGNNSSHQNTDSLARDTVVKVDTGKIKQSTENSTKWTFTEDEDKMTSKKKYYASIDANDELQLKFPYDGGSTPTLLIRYKDGENNAILSVTKGQFISNVVDGESIKIRFDNDQPVSFNCSSPSDGSSNMLFINSTKKLMNKLKTSKKIIIQAEFYDNGLQLMEFDVDGFKWSH